MKTPDGIGKLRQNQPFSINLKPGDVVKIRSKGEIQKTLDNDNRFEGCLFMEEMWQYCDTKQKVLKKVEYILDENKGKFFKVKNVFFLEGLYCSGKLFSLKKECNRSCLFFWKQEWIEKIE
jgi:hypothetical protein